MTIQPEYTPAQQAVRDAIQAWRDGPDSRLTQAEWGKLDQYRGSKTAPAGAANTSGSGASPRLTRRSS